jgi:tRNA modification GTPase
MTSAAKATVVVELTPQGRGAVAVVLVDGPDALRAVGKNFSPISGRPLESIPVNRIALGRWGGTEGEELIYCRRAEQQIEIHCHGGAAAVRAIVEDLVAEGCCPLAWTEWLRERSNSPIKAAAQIALADAITLRTAGILLDQLNGALEDAIRGVIHHIESADWPLAAERIEQLLNRRELGLHLTSPWRIVIAGAPNVGKSSLINALAGYERAIVSPTPGTTRDIVTVTTAIDGFPVQLADTAGIREARESIEAEGIKLATSAVANADLVVRLHDATNLSELSRTDLPSGVLPSFKLPRRVIHAINKVDLLAENATASLMIMPDAILVCALTRHGIESLISTIARALVPHPPASGEAIPFTQLQCDHLLSAKDAVANRDEATASAALQSFFTGR